MAANGNGKSALSATPTKVNGDVAAPNANDVDLLGLNRYPDPSVHPISAHSMHNKDWNRLTPRHSHQHDLKQLLCDLRNDSTPNSTASPTSTSTSTTDTKTTHTTTTAGRKLTPEHLFVGVGSDEAIDALLRAFCRPGTDKMLTCPPTYGMYAVSAQVNDVAVVHVPLLASAGFAVDADAVAAALTADRAIKLVYLCSPGNPTGALVSPAAVEALLAHPSFNGILVVDEAYIDFAPAGASLAPWVARHPNLVVMQTLSKAFGLAGLRLGAAFCAPPVAALLNALKAPYNVSSPTSALACAALRPASLAVVAAHRDAILAQRARLVAALGRIAGVGRLRGGLDANFVLVEMLDAQGRPSNAVAVRVYEELAGRRGVVVRFRGRELGCEGCLRVTVGTEAEVDRFLDELTRMLKEVRAQVGSGKGVGVERQQGQRDSAAGREEEQRREESASAVVT